MLRVMGMFVILMIATLSQVYQPSDSSICYAQFSPHHFYLHKAVCKTSFSFIPYDSIYFRYLLILYKATNILLSKINATIPYSNYRFTFLFLPQNCKFLEDKNFHEVFLGHEFSAHLCPQLRTPGTIHEPDLCALFFPDGESRGMESTKALEPKGCKFIPGPAASGLHALRQATYCSQTSLS